MDNAKQDLPKKELSYLAYIQQVSRDYYHENLDYIKNCVRNINSLICVKTEPKSDNFYKNYKSNCWFEIDESLGNRLNKVAKIVNISLYSVFVYIYGLFIYFNKSDKNNSKLLIGTTTSGRESNNTQSMMGLFSQRILIDISEIEEQTNLTEKLIYIQSKVNVALSNQLLSMNEVPNCKRFLHEKNILTPQFNIVFQNFASQNKKLSQLKAEIIKLENRYYSLDEMDMTLVIYELMSKVVYDT